MDVEKILQQLKTIAPDANFAASSRHLILATERPSRRPFSVARFIFSNLQSAGAIALTGVLFILILGAFSVFRFLNPLRISSLDPAGLHAEAQAVDMQIQIADLSYQEAAAPPTTTAPAVKRKVRAASPPPSAGTGLQNETSTPVGSSTPSMTVDDALDILSH